MSFLRSLPFLSLLLGASFARGSETHAPPGHEEPVALEQLIVTGSAFAKAQADLAQSTAVIGQRALALRQSNSLGETLGGETGISATYFGPGASRPVIRGLGGDRVRVLENGLGTFDVSQVSPDHATSVEPLFIERIEVVRGPATLLHGNAAIGGVVNTFDGRVPEERAAGDVAGVAELRFGGPAREAAAALKLRGDSGDITWQARAFRRQASDTHVPRGNFRAAAGAPVDDPNFRARSIPNTSLRTDGASGGATWFGHGVSVGAAFTGYETEYGIPLAPAPQTDDSAGGEVEEGPVRIRLRQRRVDARASIEHPFAVFSGARLELGRGEYSHTEFAGGEAGTRFDQRAHEVRLALPHLALGQLTGEFGAQHHFTDLHAAGDEAFLPPVKTTNWAAFVNEELVVGRITLQGGVRREHQRVSPAAGSGARPRTFAPTSFSLGAVWALTPDWALAVSAAQTRRAPSATELFADGPHAGTQAYEIGDAALGSERGRSLELSLRRRAGFVTGTASIFTNQFSNYLVESATGRTRDGLPEYRFAARAAKFDGAELETWWHLHERGGRGLDLKLAANTVRATDLTSGAPLPRIPASRALAALRYTHHEVIAGIGVTHTFAQHRTAPGESGTAAFTLLDADLSWRFGRRPGSEAIARSDAEPTRTEPREWLLFLRGTNLTDREARNHASFLKDIAPLPGRGITAGLRASF